MTQIVEDDKDLRITMKIRAYSDIHNEFLKGREWEPIPLYDDSNTILILAGDIDVGKRLVPFVDRMCDRFRAVVYILGNHELYGRNIDNLTCFMSNKSNAFFLNNNVTEICGWEFIGTTLWTDLDNQNPLLKTDGSDFLNDFKHIKQLDRFASGVVKESSNWIRFTTQRWIEENNKARLFLKEKINPDVKQVVITHHGPNFLCARGNPAAGNSYDGFYYNRGLENLIMDSKLWIFGHTHHKYDQNLEGCRVYSNPRGYATDLVPEFDNGAVIELE